MIPTHSIWDSRRGFLYIFASVLKWRATLSNERNDSNQSNKAFIMICVLKVACESSPIYSNHEPGWLMFRISFNVVCIRLSIIMRRYLTRCTMRLLSKQPTDILIFQNFAAEGACSRSPPPHPPESLVPLVVVPVGTSPREILVMGHSLHFQSATWSNVLQSEKQLHISVALHINLFFFSSQSSSAILQCQLMSSLCYLFR